MADVISALASPIVQLAVEKLALLIQDKILTLAGFEKDVKTLQDKFKDIQKVIEVAEKGRRRSEVTDLLEELKDATHDAENVLDMLSTELLQWNEKQQGSIFPSVSPEWIFRLKNRSVVNDINDIMERFDSIHMRFLAMDDLLRHVKEESDSKEKEKEDPTSSPVMHPGVVGRVKEKSDIIELLKSGRYGVEGRVSVTPITGMGGIGKTVLAQQVYNDNELAGQFEVKIWIAVSDGDGVINMKRIFDEIIAACAKDYNSQGSLEAILQHSVEGLKLLLVLDDVWSENLEDWKKLEKGLMKADKGTRVIVTGRTENVFGLSPENILIPHISLGKLPHEECLKLFARNAIDGDESVLESKGVKTIADEIVSKCDGLPLAVEVIGCLLRTKPLDTWSDILNNDLAKVEEEFRDEKHRTLFVLKLSFYYLPPELKQCFSFCSIFPKGYEFDKDELVKLWMAHSLIQPSKLAERLEDKGRRYFDRLRVLSFFQQQPELEKYRMHDYLHDLAELVSGKYSCIVKGENPIGIDQKTHHVSLICEKVERATKVIDKCKRLRTFLMPMSRNSLTNFDEALGKMFQTLKYLRVLDLSSSRLSKLPKTVAELKLLRYLNMSKTEIKWLPNALCSLQNLQTLKLLDCPWFLGLPKGLSRLINLRHLEIDEAFWKYKCSMQPPNIGRLNCLHNLHKFWVGESNKGSGLEELKDMKYLEGSLHIMELNNAVNAAEASLKDKPRLRVLELEWASEREDAQLQGKTLDDYDVEVLEGLEPHSNLVELNALVRGLHSNHAAMIKKIAGLVFDFYKRPNLELSPTKASLEETSNVSENKGVQMLGQIKHGSCRPRAILFKVLADTVGLDSRLMVGLPTEGNSECIDSYKHMSVLVVLNSVELLVDLMRFPGQLIPLTTKAIYMTHISAAGESDSAENDSCDSPLEPNSPLYGVSERVDPESTEKDDSPQYQRRLEASSNAAGPSLRNAMLRSSTFVDGKLSSYHSEPNIAATFWRRSRRRVIAEQRTASSSPEHPSARAHGRSMLSGDNKSFKDYSDDLATSRSEGASTSETRRIRRRSISITPEIGDDIVRAVRAMNETLKQNRLIKGQGENRSFSDGQKDISEFHLGDHDDLSGGRSSLYSFQRDHVDSQKALSLPSSPNEYGSETPERSGTSNYRLNEDLVSTWNNILGSPMFQNKPLLPFKDWNIDFSELTVGTRVGIGFFGEVFRGIWNGTDVAIKVFLEQDLTAENMEDFCNEISILSRLRHPNVILFLGACTRPPRLSMVTEYMEMGSLYYLIHLSGQKKKLSWRRSGGEG